MSEKKRNVTAIVIAVAAVVIIGGLVVFGIISMNGKNDELDAARKELAQKTESLTQESEQLSKTKEELEKTRKELEDKQADLAKSLEEYNAVLGERDKLKEEDEARKKAEADTTASDEAEQEAIGKMLSLMDEVEKIQEGLNSIDFDQDLDTILKDINEYSISFGRYSSDFVVLKDVPANFYNAGKEYMELNKAMFDEIYELFDFMVAYYASADKYGEFIDLMSSADTAEEWVYSSLNCIEELLTLISEAECPQYLTAIWDRWEKAANLTYEFVFRMCDGFDAQDYLRIDSANSLVVRISKIMANLCDEIGEAINEAVEFFGVQGTKSKLIYEEMGEAKKLPYGERALYGFKNTFESEVKLSYKTLDDIYPSLFNTYDHFVTIEAGCVSGARDIVVECEIPGLTQKYEQKVSLTSRMQLIYVKPSASTTIRNLDSAWDTMIKVTIKDVQGNLIDSNSFPVHIYSVNDFQLMSDEFGVCTWDNILCFLSPDSVAVSELKRKAIDILESWSDGEFNAFTGYQGPTYSEYMDTFIKAAALLTAMSESGVRYNMDTFSLSGSDKQHILFPKQVLDQKSGLCVETSLVIASALQSAELHTYLLFPEGHAQVAVEIWDGLGEYYLIETTMIPCDWDDFEEYFTMLADGSYDNDIGSPIIYLNREEWESYIENGDIYLVDCSDGNMLGLTPFGY